MALPATDDFAGTGALSASWTNAMNTLTRVGGIAEVGTDNVDCLAFWNADSFTAAQKSVCTIGGTLTSGALYVGAAVRADASGGGNAYVFYTDGASGAGHTEIAKLIGGVFTVLQSIATTFATADTIELRVNGSTLQAFKNSVQVGSDQATGGQLTGGASAIYAFHSTGASAGGVDAWTGDNVAGGGFTAKFKKTRSGIGTKVGSKQTVG